MAFEVDQLTISLPCATDLSTKQYCAVTVDGNGNAALPADGGVAVGVLQNNPKAGQTAAVRVAGVTYMVASAAVNAGQLVTTDANGQAKPAAAGNHVVGIALDTVAAAGEVVSVLLKSVATA
ncbi:MAG: DUF2190 family protein [Alicyclobacillus macrosporangiidus]|uniref:DUF2190 family protein n=1 Tax=Alicyclobacillus macrosporangiidus TaxID=392015 RepID=UPI0026EA44BB|nr:DUF2190 family protein [Alicyclobacillus macrosporangiidus]MCL6597950.1 DUF2190 family protein [Alicyclobacillus macrosporangiidus]